MINILKIISRFLIKKGLEVHLRVMLKKDAYNCLLLHVAKCNTSLLSISIMRHVSLKYNKAKSSFPSINMNSRFHTKVKICRTYSAQRKYNLAVQVRIMYYPLQLVILLCPTSLNIGIVAVIDVLFKRENCNLCCVLM